VHQARRTPPAATAGVWHVEAGGDRAVLKVVRNGGEEGRWPARDAESDPYWWKREPVAYTSGAIDRFAVPHLRACVERGDGSVALWLDDEGGAGGWTIAAAYDVARRLGEAQAAPVPEHDWLVPGFLDEYLRLHAADEPDPRLGGLPQVLCHNDFHPGNVLANGVVIDWAYCGIGAAGLDAGVFVVDGIADAAFAAADADELAAAVRAGYAEGFGADPGLGFIEGARRLRWLPRGERPEWDATLALIERLPSG
jgi:hypothetical protein